jgi:4-carboxymuconolactone decarboxylase
VLSLIGIDLGTELNCKYINQETFNKNKRKIIMAIPKRFQKFTEDYPDVANAYEALGNAVHSAGPLDEKTRSLIKLAISTGARLEGAVHSHARKALKAGAKPEEMRQTVLLALPTIGLPSMMAALSWLDDIIDNKEKQ